MKRTLFLALTLLTVSTASATITSERGQYGINSLVGEEVFTRDTAIDSAAGYYDAVLCVGTYAGEGHLTLEKDVTLTLPNAVLIGGKGYSMPQDTAHNGTMVIKQGAVLNVGSKTESSGGHHVDVGNSGFPVEGHLLVDGGSVYTGQFLIGQEAGRGTVVVTNGGYVDLSWDGITPQANPANDQIGLTIGNSGGSGKLIIDNGRLTDVTNSYSFIGCSGDASVELKNGAVWETSYGIIMGDVWDGAYGQGTGTDTISVSQDSTFFGAMLQLSKGAEVENKGSLTMAYGVALFGDGENPDACTLTNEGTLNAMTSLVEVYGGMLDNSGAMNAKAVVLGDNSTFVTGELVVSGCENAMAQHHDMEVDFRTGLTATTAVVIDPDGSALTIGTRVNGGETMQYLYSDDIRTLDDVVRYGLNLQRATDYDAYDRAAEWESYGDPADLQVANILGKNITANVTTDEASENGGVIVALSGSRLVVRVGDDGAEAPTEEDRKRSAEKVGTLGSYDAEVTETGASIRLHTEATDSVVTWEGHYMETVTGENTTVNDTTGIKIGSDGVEGTLTVVKDSTLKNLGEVSSDKVVINGTLDNNGTVDAETTVNGTLKGSGVMAATTLAETATLIVGNSPGYSTFTDALTAQSGSTIIFCVSGVDTPASLSAGTGWDSQTYSQIVMENGAAVTLCDGVNITIAIGGDTLCSAMTPLHEGTVTPFELILIKGGVSDSLDSVNLMNHTRFTLSEEEGALPLVLTGQSWVIEVAHAYYTVSGGNLVLNGDLTVTRTPEPATSTLSLLALAALAARRRR